jgi:hypothetical protein
MVLTNRVRYRADSKSVYDPDPDTDPDADPNQAPSDGRREATPVTVLHSTL